MNWREKHLVGVPLKYYRLEYGTIILHMKILQKDHKYYLKNDKDQYWLPYVNTTSPL